MLQVHYPTPSMDPTHMPDFPGLPAREARRCEQFRCAKGRGPVANAEQQTTSHETLRHAGHAAGSP